MADSHYGAGTAVEGANSRSDEASNIVRQLAHDLRQPLSVIESVVYYLGIVLPRDEPRARQQLDKVRDQIRQINWTIGDALHLLQALSASVEPADLNHLVSRSLSEWAESEDIHVRVKLGAGLPHVEVDTGQIHHLLHSLVVFFEQMSDSAEQPVVTTSIRPDGVCLAVHGAAAPASAEDWQRLLDRSGAVFPHGSALSLACIRRICETHRARFEAEARPPSGFTLAVVFPATSASV